MHIAINKYQCYTVTPQPLLTCQCRLMYLFQMQIVGKHYSQETSFQVRFGRSKISLDIPEDGKLTKEGWRLTPSTHPTVSDTETANKNCFYHPVQRKI